MTTLNTIANKTSDNCCTTQHINCYTPQYQRLSLFTSYITNGILSGNTSIVEIGFVNIMTPLIIFPYNRSGQQILLPIPECNLTQPNIDIMPDNPSDLPPGAYCQSNSGCTGDSFYAPEELITKYIARSAYYFVNEFAYSPFEPGCHSNQVYGWFVNVQTGELQLFTQFKNVPQDVTRNCLSNTIGLTKLEKSQLKIK